MNHGRPKTTGRFRTRRELLEKVHFLWTVTSCNMSAIARNCHVSPPVIAKIIDDREWKKNPDWRVQDYGDYQMVMADHDTGSSQMLRGMDREAPDLRHVKNRPVVHFDFCGAGYTPGECPVHLPDRVKRELEII